MAQNLTGGCACDAIRYEANADPVMMVNCHCRDCQKAGGGAYAAVMVVPNSAIRLSAEPRYHKTVGDSGSAIDRGFCPNCGCHVTVKLARFPDMIGLHAGSLDDPSRYKPGLDLFAASAQPWDHMDPKVEKRPRGFTN